jgi:hypothetical protein
MNIGDIVKTNDNQFGKVISIRPSTAKMLTTEGETVVSISKLKVIDRGGYLFRYYLKKIEETYENQ